VEAERAWPWLGLAVRIAAAAIWLVAGVAKLSDVTSFQQQLTGYDVLPHGTIATVGYGLPLLEIVLGGYLLVGALVRPAAILSCVLMCVFIVAQGQAWARGLAVDCGCFGSLQKEHVGPGSVLRDIGLLIPSAILVWRPARLWSVDERLLGLPDRFRFRVGGPPPIEEA
jgi:uncharacterized membrane protein YphA (DoxX/SURF4 family)